MYNVWVIILLVSLTISGPSDSPPVHASILYQMYSVRFACMPTHAAIDFMHNF